MLLCQVGPDSDLILYFSHSTNFKLSSQVFRYGGNQQPFFILSHVSVPLYLAQQLAWGKEHLRHIEIIHAHVQL